MRGEWPAPHSFRSVAEEESFNGWKVVTEQNCHQNREVVQPPSCQQNQQLDLQLPAHMANGGNSRNCSVYHDKTSSSGDNQLRLGALCSISAPPKPPLIPPPAAAATAAVVRAEGLKKMCCSEEDGPCPFPSLAAGVLEMRVKEGSKIRNLMGFAMARVQGGGGAGLRQVVFSGSGRALTKTITCAEIMKRKVGDLHQLTKLRYKVVREVWGGGATASGTTVQRTVPSISILLSKDPLDPLEPGYQPPEALLSLWREAEEVGGDEGASSSYLGSCKKRTGLKPRPVQGPGLVPTPGPRLDLQYGPLTPPRWKRARLAREVTAPHTDPGVPAAESE